MLANQSLDDEDAFAMMVSSKWSIAMVKHLINKVLHSAVIA